MRRRRGRLRARITEPEREAVGALVLLAPWSGRRGLIASAPFTRLEGVGVS